MPEAVNEATVKRVIGGLKPGSTDSGGYCEARARLPQTLIATLVRDAGGIIAKGAAPWRHWQGRQVRLVDGPTVTLPDTEENQATFRRAGAQGLDRNRDLLSEIF